MAAIIAMYLALPGLRAAMLFLAGLSGAAAILLGLTRRRPVAPAAPPLLVAGAGLCFAASGAVVWVGMGGQRSLVPSVTVFDILALARYPLLAAALWLIARRRSLRDRRNIIDAVTVTIGVAMLLWIFRILPDLLAPGMSAEQRTVSIAYAVVQIAVTLALARLLVPGLVWSTPVWLTISGAACALAGSVVFGLLRVNGAQVDWWVVDIGWMVCFALIGAAALHPAMGALARPVDGHRDEVSRGRLIFLMAASIVAPVLTAFGHHTVRGTVISVSGTVLTLVVLARLWTVDVSRMRRLAWEQALHAAGPALASADSLEEIAATLRTASDTIFDPRAGRGGVFATLTGGEFRVMMMSRVPGRHGRLTMTARDWLPLLLPLLIDRVAAGQREPVYLAAEKLASMTGLGDLKSGSDGVLLCPLTVSDQWPGDPLVGVFALIGGHWSRPSQRSLEIIASEVGLAMERVLLSQELVRRQSQEVFEALVRDTADAILIIDDDDRVSYATPSAAGIFGEVPIKGANVRRLLAACEPEWNPDGPYASIAGNNLRDFHDLWRIKRHDGRTVLVLGKMSDMRADPAVRGRVWTLRDVTEERHLQDELRHRAFHDSLTGLANRMLFADRADHALSLTKRTGTVAAVLFVDLDDFKEVNDTRGHGVGDELLAGIGRRLGEVAKEPDTVARIGGDEFALLIENLTAPAEADIVADRVGAAFRDPFLLSQGEVTMTATVGVATSDDSDTVDELMRHADMALYAAKAASKGGWQRYSPAISTSLHHRIEMRSALEEAITAEQFTLAYQPIVSLQTGMIAGFESLIRWPHPQRGMMMPGQFIGVAEDTGLIVPIGSWVLARAVADVARLRDRDAGSPYVSVNVAARQFRTAGFVTMVKEALESSGLPAFALVLELTESSLLRRDGDIAAELSELKELGIRLAIDDFGTGYSSLSYLREMPIDVVKIDRSFVDGIDRSPDRLALVKGIVAIAHTLGMSVIAEGVETDEQCQLLTEIGCEYGQGYLMAKPLDLTKAGALLRSGQPLTSPPRLSVAVPRPDRNLPQGVQLVFGGGVRVLHRDLRAELDVGTHGVAERLVVGQAGGIQRGQVELDEPLALLFGDLQVAVDLDQVPEAEFTTEAVGPAEGFGGEPCQVLYVIGLARPEQWPQQRVG
jgi:diguanylate cyclase (GGDEF)-like protein/PAS domain S-box-containing protein